MQRQAAGRDVGFENAPLGRDFAAIVTAGGELDLRRGGVDHHAQLGRGRTVGQQTAEAIERADEEPVFAVFGSMKEKAVCPRLDTAAPLPRGTTIGGNVKLDFKRLRVAGAGALDVERDGERGLVGVDGL